MKYPGGLFLALNTNFLVLGVLNVADEVTLTISLLVAGFGLAVIFLQLGAVLCLERLERKRWGIAASALFSGANFLAFYASFVEEIIRLPSSFIFVGAFCLSALFGAGFLHARSNPRFGSAAILLLVTMATGAFLFDLASSVPDNRPVEVSPAFDKYRIKLRETPNIHLVAFDSLMPKALVRKYLGTEAPYADYLESRSAVMLRNTFVGQSPSVPSLTDLLRLSDPSLYAGYKGGALIPGRRPSPITVLLSTNGYRIAVGFPDDFLGSKGPFVDVYNTPDDTKTVLKSALCLTATDKEKSFQLYGFCNLFANFHSKDGIGKAEWPDFILREIVEKTPTGQPSFTLHYIYMPIGHTGKSYDHTSSRYINGYRAYYEAQSKVLTSYLKKLVDAIEQHDPGSIVFIFGDHGPYLSRGVEPRDASSTEFYVQDRYGVFGALLKTRHACVDVAARAYTAEIVTPSRILAGIFRCLAVNPEEVDRVVQFKEDFDFRNFRYE